MGPLEQIPQLRCSQELGGLELSSLEECDNSRVSAPSYELFLPVRWARNGPPAWCPQERTCLKNPRSTWSPVGTRYRTRFAPKLAGKDKLSSSIFSSADLGKTAKGIQSDLLIDRS